MSPLDPIAAIQSRGILTGQNPIDKAADHPPEGSGYDHCWKVVQRMVSEIAMSAGHRHARLAHGRSNDHDDDRHRQGDEEQPDIGEPVMVGVYEIEPGVDRERNMSARFPPTPLRKACHAS
jgi:hypothetical protein